MNFSRRFFLLFTTVGLSLALSGTDAGAKDVVTKPAIASINAGATKPLAAESRWLLTEKPVPGELSSDFGVRPDPVHGRRKRRRKRTRHHKGVDFVASRGTLVHAAGPGIVVRAGFSGGYGRVVIVDHGQGLQTRYAHLQKIKTKKGEFLPAGAVLGSVGSSGRTTGPHLHFEVRQDGVALPPQDVIQFELPRCARRARHCDRGKRPNS
jgi:murein DD-endopeptidase MepM/ murein hydrolase activator NlpD